METNLIDKLIVVKGQEHRVEDVTESRRPHHYRIHLYNGEALTLFYKDIANILNDGDYTGEVQVVRSASIVDPSKGLFTTPPSIEEHSYISYTVV